MSGYNYAAAPRANRRLEERGGLVGGSASTEPSEVGATRMMATWPKGSHIILIIFTTGNIADLLVENKLRFSPGLFPRAPSPPPSIVSLPKTVSLAKGERAVLECAVGTNLT